jgi:hypothetical protein
MSEEEFNSALEELLATTNEEMLGRTIAGVLEFLTVRAIVDGPFYLLTDDEKAITVVAADEAAQEVKNALPENIKSWDEYEDDNVTYLNNVDPGDEQDEPATESE